MIFERAYDLAEEVEDLYDDNLELIQEVEQKDKELAIYKKALELAVKRVNKTIEEPNPAIEMFVNLAKAELETKKPV